MERGKLINVFLLVLLSIFNLSSFAQYSSDTPDSRLAMLCKTWGFVKYYHQNQCNIHWDDLLNKTIEQVLRATTNEQFNAALINMLNTAGPNEKLPDPGIRPDTNLLVHTEWITNQIFSTPVQNFLRTFTSTILPNRLSCLATTNLNNPNVLGHIDFTGDPITIPIDYTIESNRLTAMFYYWNIINYFFPYQSLMDQSWDQTLLGFIPQFRKPQSARDFHLNVMQLANRLNDSHGFVSSDTITQTFWKGTYMPRICLQRIEGKCVISKEDIIGIAPGAVLTEIDGQPVSAIEDSLEHYLPYSNPAAKYRLIYHYMLRGRQGTQMRVTLINSRGDIISKVLTRDCSVENWLNWRNLTLSKETYKITECGYGYVNMGTLQPDDVDAMYAQLKSTPAIIFDLRTYPNETLLMLSPLLFKTPITSALYYIPAITFNIGIDPQYYMPGWFYRRTDLNEAYGWNNPDAYSGKIYILVDENSMSQSEYTCQYLSYHPNATVIGRQTSGADGPISTFYLPGGIRAMFTSIDWRYADGYQQQRKGVKIDTIVEPTVQGIREGKDEILLAALKCISGSASDPLHSFTVSVYPNPVISREIKVKITAAEHCEASLTLMDLTGKTIFQDRVICQPGDQTFFVNLPALTPGLYILKTRDDKQAHMTKLIIQ